MSDVYLEKSRGDKGNISLAHAVAKTKDRKADWVVSWGDSLLLQVGPVFCVPGNSTMLRVWDRVEDRLFKLRHCMDIDGNVRQLPLFAPELNPALLAFGKASGLGLEDILNVAAGGVPPYRFRYLVDRAKAFAASVQSLGGAMLSAIEKRDAEELTKLRNLQHKNMSALLTEAKRNEIAIADENLNIANRRRAAANYRKEYYAGLVASGLSGAEKDQRAGHHTASGLKGAAAVLDTLAGIAHLIPQLGSPFAMKYGGLELGASAASWSQVLLRAAGVAEAISSVRGMDAGFERREQAWEHQVALADHDLSAADREVISATLRKTIAEHALVLHEKLQEQHDEVIELFGEKFSNLGLYTHLSQSLQTLHRNAYNDALALARLAEQAYRFERPGDATVFVGGEWESTRQGLLAGERLFAALQAMERRYIETNPRLCEINQSFSLSQVNPRALLQLKETGTCEFSISELHFDLFYPGQYQRRLRGVRLTIPCVTGPYTNVSAKLTLLASQVRTAPALGAAHLVDVPLSGTTSVATSTGQGDAGVFELNFRDERYMPFEGAGAVWNSPAPDAHQWRIELPASFRPFDYQTINDVILNLSYTAQEDGLFRQQVEQQNAALQGTLRHWLANQPSTRILSLRQEMSSAFNRLMWAPAGTAVTIDIGERHFPLVLQGQNLQVVSASLVLVLRHRSAVGAVSIVLNGVGVPAFSETSAEASPTLPFGGLPFALVTNAFVSGLKKQHQISLQNAGNLAAPAAAGGPLVDPEKLVDVLLAFDYVVS
ncbi:MAG: hypothetical protein IPK82_29190 [Polyangiaceae bacterium]|nr:hypothetical protein [Polyangiaceae bacterium]